MKYLVAMALVAVFSFFPSFRCWSGESASFRSPAAMWTIGDSWLVVVDIPGVVTSKEKSVGDDEKAVKESVSFKMKITIQGSSMVDGKECLTVQFTPERGTPATLREGYAVLVERNSGWPIRVLKEGDEQFTMLTKVQDAQVVTAPPDFVPLEIVPLSSLTSRKMSRGNRLLLIDQRKVSGAVVLECNYQSGKQLGSSLQVVWRHGEKWWHEFKRFKNNKLNLSAKLIAKEPANVALWKSDETPLARAPLTREKTDEQPMAEKYDSGILKTITLSLRSPRLSALCIEVGKQLDLKLVIGGGIDPDLIVFSNVSWNNIPAWSVLDQIASAKGVNGKWEKAVGGYRLTSDQSNEEGGGKHEYSVLWLIPLSLGVGGIWVWVWYRKKRATKDI